MNSKKSNKKPERTSGVIVAAVTIGVIILLMAVVAILLSAFDPENVTPPIETTATTDDGTSTSPEIHTVVDPDGKKRGYYTFLVAGLDNISRSTDVMMLISLDTANNSLNVLQIPRDTFVNKEVGGYTSVTRVNSVYSAAYNRAVSSGTRAASARHIAMKDLCSRLEESLSVDIDEYVLIDTAAFRGIVDAIGGVWFDVPRDMDYDDPEQELYIHLKAGYQLLDGEAAEGLIRYRKGYARGDIDRISLRGDFIRAMFEQITGGLNVSSAVSIMREMITSVYTSVSVTDLVTFAIGAYDVSSDDMRISTISGSTVMNPADGTWNYFVINRAGAINDLNTYFNARKSDITEESFDPKGFFTDSKNANHEYINNYYLS